MSDAFLTRRGGGGEDLTPELTEQSALIAQIRAMLVGRVTEANAKPEDILKGKKAYVGEKLVEGTLSLNPIKADLRLENIPYNITNGSAVVLNGEIHILGGATSSKNHYKYDGSTWKSVSILPYNLTYGSAIVFNDEIQILGGNDTVRDKRYKFSDSAWTELPILPLELNEGIACTLDRSIYVGKYSNFFEIQKTLYERG